MKALNYLLIFVWIVMIGACEKDDADPTGNLEGRWNVKKVEGQQYNNGSPGIYLSDNNPTGYIEFNRNGSGEQNYSFTLFGTTYLQNDQFSFTANAGEISIDLFNEPDMVWAREVNTSMTQVASYDIPFGANGSIKYTLTLEK